MKTKCAITILLFLTVLFLGCKKEDETTPILRITDITPGMTILGGSTLNTAVIGDTMTITGEGFSAAAAENTITVQGVATPVLTASATQLQATVPVGVPFSYVDVVVNRQGYQASEQKISVRSRPSPVIARIQPTQGSIGSVVTIYGKHLLELIDANHLVFTDVNGQQGALYIRPFLPVLATTDSIRLRIPAGAGTGRIELYARPAQDVANSYFSVVTPVFTVRP